MTTSNYILQSKANIKPSESLNITYELLKNYEELHDNTDKSFLQIIPVRIVASNESFFKEYFGSILNHNEKYLTNSKSLLKRNGTKIELEDVLYISKSKFTIGDLVAYSLTYSSIETILKNFEEITEIKIYSELDNTPVYFRSGDKKNKKEVYTFEKGRVLKNLKEIYELRNIICHDFLSSSHKISLNSDSLRQCIIDAVLLQQSIDYLCSKYIYIDIPLDYIERLQYFRNIIENKLIELELVYSEIESTLNSEEQKDNLTQNKELFMNYLNKDSDNLGHWFRDVSNDFPFEDLCLEYKIKLIDARLEILRNEIKNCS